MSAQTLETRALKYELEVPIDAPADAVWSALTEETNAWWLPDFHMVGADSVVTLDCRAGGALVESLPDGGSLLWYTVHMVNPGKSLHLVGHLGSEFGGPATTLLALTLEDQGGRTLLKVTDALVGHVNEENADCLAEGWRQLFTEGLAAHAAGAAAGKADG